MNRYVSAQISEYVSRINKVLDYVDTHLDEDLNIEIISQVAGFSPFHFHRIFTAMLGETMFSFIGRLRMEKAARILCGPSDITITEAALSCGFSSPAAFSRAFREAFGVSPSEWKGKYNKSNLGKVESNLYQALRNADKAGDLRLSYDGVIQNMDNRRETMKTLQGDVKVADLETMTVSYVRHIGPYAGDEKLFQSLYEKLYAWAIPRGIVDMKKPEDTTSVVIYHDDPAITEPDKLRISVGILVPPDTEVSGEVGKLIIPAGRYAMGRFVLSGQEYGEAWQHMYGVWLPGSGYQPDEGYCFEMYHYNKDAEKAGKCDSSICISVKPL